MLFIGNTREWGRPGDRNIDCQGHCPCSPQKSNDKQYWNPGNERFPGAYVDHAFAGDTSVLTTMFFLFMLWHRIPWFTWMSTLIVSSCVITFFGHVTTINLGTTQWFLNFATLFYTGIESNRHIFCH